MVNKSAKVLYVEPNWTNADIDATNQSSPSTSVSLRQQALEDFCIYVNLEVEKKGRMVTAAGGQEGTTYVLRWTNSEKDGDRVSFMQGRKIKTENSGEINSLTTNYTTYLTDIKDGDETVEMFGISSIDINYDKYMVPNVTIQFVDVRGAALFSLEERSHQGYHNNIGGFLSDDIASSFFSCFFTFPYPRFYLTVKGFYGQPVAYELTCTSFNTSFDSSTGNFNVTVTMAGYYFSFFNDVSFNALVAAPYSDAGGKQYWDSRVAMMDDDFYLVGPNGERKEMVTLGSLLVSLANVSDKIKGMTEGDEAHTRQSELQDKAAELSDVLNARGKYIETVESELSAKDEKIRFKSVDGGRYVAFVSNKPYVNDNGADDLTISDLNSSKEAYGIYKKMLADNNIGVELKDFEQSFYKACIFKFNPGIERFWPSGIGHLDDNKALYNALDNFAKADKERDKYNFFNYSLQSDVKSHYAYYGLYQDLGNGVADKVQTATNETLNEMAQNAEDVSKSEGDALATILGFEPTAYNITKILMAHFECLVKLYYDLAIKIYDTKEERTPENLGIGDVKTDANIKGFIPPFPKLSAVKPLRSPINPDTNMDGTGGESTTIVDGNGQTMIEEDEWVGNLSSNFLEEDFINGLLNGAFEVGQLIRKSEAEEGKADTNENGESDRVCAVSIPVCPMDMVLTGNPWGTLANGNEGNNYDYAAFVGKCFYRMTTVLAASNPYGSEIPAGTLGTADAINFSKLFASPGKQFADKLSTMDFDNFFMGIVNGTAKDYAKDGVWPWTPQTGSNMALNKSGSELGPSLPKHDGAYLILPVCGVSYQQIKNDLKMSSDGSCQEPKRLDNYVNTFQVNTDVENHNAFTLDVRYGDYGNFVKNVTLTDSAENSGMNTVREKAFAGCEFSFEAYKSYYNEDKLNDMLHSNTFKSLDDVKSVKVKRIFGVKNNGKDNGFGISPNGNIFASKQFISIPDSKRGDKGFLFLAAFKELFDFSKIIEDLSSGKPSFRIMPRLVGICIGSYVWAEKNQSAEIASPFAIDKLSKATKARCYSEFIKFNHSEMDKILEVFSPGFNSAILSVTGEIDDDDMKNYVDPSRYSAVYKSKDVDYRSVSDSFDIEFSEECDTSLLSELLFKPAMFATTVSLDQKGKVNDSFSPSIGKAYWEAFIKQLQVQYESITSSSGSTSESTTTTGKETDTPTDVKIALYNYCKTFFDKWIAGGSMTDDFEKRWKLSNYFKPGDNKNGRFHFIDGFYNDMSDRILFNPTILAEDVKASASQNNLSLMTAMSDVLSKNRFNLMCLQNFISLDTSDSMVDIFKPIPYYQMKMPDEYPHFVATYTYEPSKHLDIEGAEYENDGFMINGDSSMWPMAISSKNLGTDYLIPAFGVAYGMQYQSYFKDITLGTDNAQNTEQSLKVQYELAGVSTETVKAKAFVTWGQDLFSIYSNTSYNASVTMLGCAWVQPMMYFCLTNIPMFRGTYLITKTSHQIRPGEMTTNFTGVRMSNVGSRIAKNWVAKSYVVTGVGVGQGGGAAAQEPGSYASVNNDCPYMIFPLYGGDGNYTVGLGADATERAKQGMRFFKEKLGCDDIHAAAIGGNICAESGWDPNIQEKGDSKAGEGLLQWTDKSRRVTKWAEYYKARYPGKTVPRLKNSKFDEQLWYIKYEREGSEKGNYKVFLSKTTLDDATTTFCDEVERPGKHAHETRIAYAKEMLALLQGTPSSTQGQSSSTSQAEKDTNKIESNGLSVRDNALVAAIRQSISKSGQINGDIQVSSEKSDKFNTIIVIESSEKVTLASVMDMCVNGYHQYVRAAIWVTDQTSGDPTKIKIVTADSIQDTAIGYSVGSQLVSQYTGLNNNFYKILYKKYGDVGTDKASFGRLQKFCIPFNGCTNQQEAANLLSGSGVQACNSQFSGGGTGAGASQTDIPDSGYQPSGAYYSTLSDSVSQRLIKLLGRKPTRTKQGDPEDWCYSFTTVVTVRARRSAGGAPENVNFRIHKGIAENLKAAFEDLLNVKGFYLNPNYGGYYWRYVKGTTKLSYHSYGLAVDLNYDINPYPPKGRRKNGTPTGDTSNPNVWRSYDHPVVKIMAKHGFGWGGRYSDYMHFSFLDGA